MKLRYFFSLIGLMILLSCQNEDPFDTADIGSITGPNPRYCLVHCGGWFIEIEGNTYHVWSFPGNLDEELNGGSFPILVELVWEPVEDPYFDNEIRVKRIKEIR